MIAGMLGVLALFPLATFALLYCFTRGGTIVAILGAGIVGAAIVGFISSAATAMASAYDPTSAVLRGVAIGFAGGVAVSGCAALVVRLLQKPSLSKRLVWFAALLLQGATLAAAQ